MKKELQADLMLLFIAVAWGASNYVISICMENTGTLSINMFRFIIGAITIALLGFKQLQKTNWIIIKYALAMSIFLTLNYLLTNLGLERTTISNAGFYCGLSVLFVPFGEWIFFKRKPEKKLALVIAICFAGVVLLSLKDDFAINTKTIVGDILCITCAFSYTINILITEKAVCSEKVNAFSLGFWQILFTAFLSTGIAYAFENPVIPQSTTSIIGLIFLGAICTGAAFVVQPIAQQYTTGTHVGLIFTLEPVFCAIIAFIFAGEVLFLHNYIGMLLLVIGILILEIDFKSIIYKRKNRIAS